jgi:hypothetical protein
LYLEQVTHQCEPLTKDFIFELALSYTDGSGMQWLTYVDVAYETVVKNEDGQVIGVYSGSGFNWQFQTNFPAIGVYTLDTHYSYIDICSGEFIEVDYSQEEEIAGSCTRHNLSTEGSESAYGKKMVCELWSKWDIFGEHQVATTQSLEWKDPWFGPADWYDEDANVSTTIHWDFVDDDCLEALVFTEANYAGDETDQCGSCDFKRAGMTNACDGNLSVQDDAVYSHHRVANEGIVLEIDLVLSTCD